MYGDSLHPDILGAAPLGWKTVLVTKDGLFSGLTQRVFVRALGFLPIGA